MGYAWKSTCYQDTGLALQAFIRDAVVIDPAGIITFTATPTISGAGLITWSISQRPLAAASATTRTGTTQLPTCTSESFSQWDSNTLLFIVAIFFAFIFGFRHGWSH